MFLMRTFACLLQTDVLVTGFVYYFLVVLIGCFETPEFTNSRYLAGELTQTEKKNNNRGETPQWRPRDSPLSYK